MKFRVLLAILAEFRVVCLLFLQFRTSEVLKFY